MFNSDHNISLFLIGFDIPACLANLRQGIELIDDGFYRPCSSGCRWESFGGGLRISINKRRV